MSKEAYLILLLVWNEYFEKYVHRTRIQSNLMSYILQWTWKTSGNWKKIDGQSWQNRLIFLFLFRFEITSQITIIQLLVFMVEIMESSIIPIEVCTYKKLSMSRLQNQWKRLKLQRIRILFSWKNKNTVEWLLKRVSGQFTFHPTEISLKFLSRRSHLGPQTFYAAII